VTVVWQSLKLNALTFVKAGIDSGQDGH